MKKSLLTFVIGALAAAAPAYAGDFVLGPNSGWRSDFFLRTRGGLVAYIREHCGEVQPEALALLAALPEWHP